MDCETLIWGLACKCCMDDMTDEQVLDICSRHDDVFKIEDKQIKFTDNFIKHLNRLL